jgi:hypothetical protein
MISSPRWNRLRFLRACLRDETLASDAFSEFSEDLVRGIAGFRGSASPAPRWRSATSG